MKIGDFFVNAENFSFPSRLFIKKTLYEKLTSESSGKIWQLTFLTSDNTFEDAFLRDDTEFDYAFVFVRCMSS